MSDSRVRSTTQEVQAHMKGLGSQRELSAVKTSELRGFDSREGATEGV